MPLFAADQETHLADYLFMQVSVQKTAVIPEDSKGLQRTPEGISKATMPNVKDSDFVMTRAALDGPDIWQDEAVMSCIFVSDRLKRAMEDAKIEPRGLHRL